MSAHSVAGPFRFAAIATDGSRMIAIRYSSDDQSPTLFYGLGIGGKDQSVMIMSEPSDEESGHWAEVPESSIVFAGEGALHIENFAHG